MGMMYGGGHGGRGRGRRNSVAGARVGLTDRNGSNGANGMAPVGPQDDAGGPNYSPGAVWANAKTTWHGFKRVLLLVWDANAGLTFALAVLNLAQGGLPAARVWISKLLVDAVVQAVTTGAGTNALP